MLYAPKCSLNEHSTCVMCVMDVFNLCAFIIVPWIYIAWMKSKIHCMYLSRHLYVELWSRQEKLLLHNSSPLLVQISGGLAYSVQNIEGRFLRFQVSCPGEDVGCLPFKIQGRAADVPGNDSNMYTYNIQTCPFQGEVVYWLYMCVCILSTSLLCGVCQDNYNFFRVSFCRRVSWLSWELQVSATSW